MSDLADITPVVEPRGFELAITSRAFNVYFYKTSHALLEVLEPNYFNGIADFQPRMHDRIEVVANAQHALLAVTEVIIRSEVRRVDVMLLAEYRS